MARAAEKAQGLLNRWTTYQTDLRSGSAKRRPYLSSECKVLPEAEKWRRELVKEISDKIESIQNAGMGEHRIRELNDEINKLVREKGHWERQIKKLGGPDYAFVSGGRKIDAQGKAVPGSKGGYKYFGAARQLPGVKELFAPPPAQVTKRTREEIIKHISSEYYGFDDVAVDGVVGGSLIRLEAEAERKNIAKALHSWKPSSKEANETMDASSGEEDEADVRHALEGQQQQDGKATISAAPTAAQVEQMVLEKKKAELLAQYELA